MARFSRQQLRLRPVKSIKHIVDVQTGLLVGVQNPTQIIEGVDNYTLSDSNGVPTGSYVRSFFLNVQVAASSTAALANVYMAVFKNPGSNIISFPNANAFGTSDQKKLVFHQEMTMTEKNTTAIPRTLFKGVIRIPKHMQRMGADDEVVVQLFSPGVTMDACLQCIYKHYE